MADDKGNRDLGLLEEDDEFEEFPSEEWDTSKEDNKDINVWEDNWDDDTVEDDFSVQLSKYSRKRSLPHSPPMRSPSPVAKKVCARNSPKTKAEPMDQETAAEILEASPNPAAAVAQTTPTKRTNGRSNGTSSPSSSSSSSNSRTRSARSSRKEDSSSSPAARTPPTRSSARLRSSRK